MKSRDDLRDGAGKVEAFLTGLTIYQRTAPATQNQAMNAPVCLYKKVLEQPLDEKLDTVGRGTFGSDRNKRPDPNGDQNLYSGKAWSFLLPFLGRGRGGTRPSKAPKCTFQEMEGRLSRRPKARHRPKEKTMSGKGPAPEWTCMH